MTTAKQLFLKNDRRFLDEETVIWRYVPLRTLFFYLNGLAFIPSVAKLRAGDPFEGEFYEDIIWFNDAFHKQYGAQANTIDEWMFKELCTDYDRQFIDINKTYVNAGAQVFRKHYFDFIRRTRFAWCWFHSYRESAAMWSVYGNQGVAIQSTPSKIAALLEGKGRPIVYGRMIYVDAQSGYSNDFSPERDTDLLLRPFFLKRKEYESENEVRFVTADRERDKGGILLQELEPQDWILAIRLWPGLTGAEESCIRKTIELLCPEVDCRKSDLFTGPDDHSSFLETLTARMDAVANAGWANNNDGIPQELKLP